MEAAESAGLLDAEYDRSYQEYRPGQPAFDASRQLDRMTRLRLLEEITCDREEPDWGTTPFFVVATEADGQWRKVMIVDSEGKLATFRNCTISHDYKPTKNMNNGSAWRLDNSMVDCGTEFMREFLTHLRDHLGRAST